MTSLKMTHIQFVETRFKNIIKLLIKDEIKKRIHKIRLT